MVTQATPEMISEAWATWKKRHGGKLGPGPAFVEAINAALAAAPAPSLAVKPLKWGEINTHGGRKIFAKSHGMEWRLDPASRTLVADKAKAQAEFEDYINSALSAQVQDEKP